MRKLLGLAFLALVACPMIVVAAGQTVPGLISYQGRLADSTGTPVNGMSVPMDFAIWDQALTQDPVTDEAVTLTGTTPSALSHQSLVSGSVVVTAVGGVPTYESPRDYSVDPVAGTITRNPTGFIPNGFQVEVDYVWNNGGSQMWSESRLVEVDYGIYSVLLGAGVPLPEGIFTDPSLFLEVTVNGETLSPRAPLTSVAYAMSAALLGGHPAADFALDGHAHSGYSDVSHGHDFSAITGSVTDLQVPDGITVLYANDAGTIEGMFASDFATALHGHTLSALSGAVTDAQVPDGITVLYANDAGTLEGMFASDFAAATHNHTLSTLNGAVTDAQVPDNITVLYAADAGKLNGLFATDFSLATHGHNFSGITGTVSDAQVPDTITILYAAEAGNAEMLGGYYAADFAPVDHSHNFNEIGGSVTDAQVPDSITVTMANNSAMLGGLLPAAYVLVAGDTVTGALQVNGALQARSGLSVLAGNIGVGQAPTVGYGIDNALGTAPTYGARLRGSTWGVQAEYSALPSTHYALLAGSEIGIKVQSGSLGEDIDATGGEFNSQALNYATGVRVNAASQDSSAYGVVSNVTAGAGSGYGFQTTTTSNENSAIGVFSDAYSYGEDIEVLGGFFRANAYGTGERTGVYAQAVANDNLDTAFGVRGITNNTSTTATTYAGYFDAQDSAGNNVGVYGRAYDFAGYFANYSDAANLWVAVGQPQKAVQVNYVTSSTLALVGYEATVTGAGTLAGASITVNNNSTSSTAYGVKSAVAMATASDGPGYAGYFTASGGDSGNRFGVYGYAAAGDTIAIAYGVYGYAANLNGPAYGVYGSASYSNDYAGYFATGKVRVGTSGAEGYVDGSGDLYVYDATESGQYYYHSPQTRYYAVSLAGSPSATSSTIWQILNGAIQCTSTNSCSEWFEVNLPDRATVSALRVWGAASETHSFSCNLNARPLTANSWTVMATVSSSTTSMTLADTTITSADIDNSTNSYILYCAEGNNTRTTTVYIYGIRIDYTIDGPE